VNLYSAFNEVPCGTSTHAQKTISRSRRWTALNCFYCPSFQTRCVVLVVRPMGVRLLWC